MPGLPGPAPIARGNQARLTGKSLRGDTVILSATIAADGTFAIANVPPGEYEVTVFPATVAPATVIVGDRAVSELQFGDLRALVTGTVAMEGGGPLPAFRLEFTREAAGPVSIDLGPRFSANLPAGSFKVAAAGLPAGFSIRSITAGAVDLTREPVTLRSGEMTPIALTVAAPARGAWVGEWPRHRRRRAGPRQHHPAFRTCNRNSPDGPRCRRRVV